jgi:hypothetical protein
MVDAQCATAARKRAIIRPTAARKIKQEKKRKGELV